MTNVDDVYSQVPESSESSPNLHTVLIATDAHAASLSVADYLEKIGYNVDIAVYDGETLNVSTNIEPNAVLCYFSDALEDLPLICKAIRARYSKRMPPLIGAVSEEGAVDSELFDSVIFPPAHHSQIANRVNSMVRLQEMEVEIALRVATLSESFGLTTDLKDSMASIRYRILFIGKASPEFMVIINALQKRNVEVVAAFTSFSAFDYLHEHSFDAVVMNALEGNEPALTIGETMRRNSKLYHVPTLFLVNEDSFTDHELAFERGARDIISARSPEPEISGRILELANYHRIHTQLKKEFSGLGGDTCLDIPSGVFNAAFFKAHMARVCKYNTSRNTNVSVLTLGLTHLAGPDVPQINIERAYAQIGNMIKNLVRMHDIVARLETDLYVIAFAGLPMQLTNSIRDRVMGIVECAGFESGHPDIKSFTVGMQSQISTLRLNEDSDLFIQRAQDALKIEMFPVDKSA